MLVAGVDSSTQSCTVEIRGAAGGELLGTGTAPHPTTTPPISEQRAEDWWQAFVVAFSKAVMSAGVAAADISAISVAAQCHGMVLVEHGGEVLRPVKLWNDTTSSVQAMEIVSDRGAAWWADETGSVPTAAFTITKLAWVAQNEPALFRKMDKIILPHDYLTYRLTERFVTDRSDASGTGYYAAHDGRWIPEVLSTYVSNSIDWLEALPEVLEPNEAAGYADTQSAKELGLVGNTIVGPGAGDQHAGALGMGLRPADVLYSLGTSGVVMAPSVKSVHDHGGWVNGVADAAGHYLPLVSTLNSTKITDFFRGLLNVNHDELARLALSAEPENGPVLLAYLEGERSPSLPNASGILAGLRTDTTRAEVARAAFEGVLAGLIRGQHELERSGVDVSGDVFVVGGGARSPAYRQILADMIDRPVHRLDVVEATARGACVQAAAVANGADVAEVRDAWRPKLFDVSVPRERKNRAMTDLYLDLARFAGDERA